MDLNLNVDSSREGRGSGEIMKMNRVWAMANKDTMQVEPIREFVYEYLEPGMVSIDPFARNCKIATYTNDLNPKTKAEYHLDVLDFFKMLEEKEIKVDLCIFDPPYSLSSAKRCYEGMKLNLSLEDTWRFGRWNREHDLLNKIVKVNGYVLSFGYNSIGMGIERYYILEEILLVCHGGAHNDTICIAERKRNHQEELEI